MMKQLLRMIGYYGLNMLVGASLALAFPPNALPWLVFVSMTFFLLGLEYRQNKSSFWYGYTFYLGAVIAFIGYWFSYYFRLQLGCGYLVSYALTSIICLYTSLYIGVISYLYNRFKTRNQLYNLLFLFPSLWVTTELIRGWFFPRSWYAFGYTQVDNPIFRGYYPLAGVYFVSWLVIAISGWLAYQVLQLTYKKITWSRSALQVLVSGLVFGGISLGLANINYTQPVGKPISVALIQPSVFSSKLYNEMTLIEIEQISTKLISETNADVFVLPETVFGTDYHYLSPGYLDLLKDSMSQKHGELIFGTPLHENLDGRQTGTVVLSDLANPVYIKHNLVPFGEYNPLKNTFLNPLLMATVGNQISEYRPGEATQVPALIKNQKFSFNICYENSINDFVAKSAQNANILLNQSDLSWYGETNMKDAFLQFSQARALENQRYFLQDGNTGDTAIIAPTGKIEKRLAPFIPGVLSGLIQGYTGITPFQVLGNFPVWILCCGVILIMLLSSKRKNN